MPFVASLAPATSAVPHVSATVGGGTTGVALTLRRVLGASSALALVSGAPSLSLAAGQIIVTSPLGGASQTIVVRETLGQLAAEYPVTVTGSGAASGSSAPAGYTYLTDADGSRLTDADGAYLMEAA